MSCPFRVEENNFVLFNKSKICLVFRPDLCELRALSTGCSEPAVEAASLWPELRSSTSSTAVLKHRWLRSKLIYLFPDGFFSLDI